VGASVGDLRGDRLALLRLSVPPSWSTAALAGARDGLAFARQTHWLPARLPAFAVEHTPTAW
jgi:hypothetical protein